MAGNHFDVLIIGAGMSGVGAACHLSRDCPDRGVALIERLKARLQQQSSRKDPGPQARMCSTWNQ